MRHVASSPFVSTRPLPLDAKGLPTVCVLCSHTCGIKVDVEGGKIVDVRADDANPITTGYVCNKAFTIPRYVDHQQRVTTPLRRGADGELHPTTWDEAIAEIAARLRAIKAEHGARSVALVGIGGQANHMDAAFGMGFLQGLGSRRWFNAYAQEKTQNHLVDSWLFEASPGVIFHADAEHSQYLLVLGTNPRVSNRGHNANETLKAFSKGTAGGAGTGAAPGGGRRMVVVDPRETETARGASRHLRVRPGADCYLLLAMASVLAQEALVDSRFLDERVAGADVVLRLLQGMDVPALSARAGIDEAAVREESRAFARAEGASVLWDLGIEHGRFSTLNAYLIRLLVVLTGNIGRRGGMYFFEAFNPPGAGRALKAPERALVSGIEGIRALGNYAMFSPSLFPEEALCDHPERIRAAIVEGANPLVSFSDSPRWREAFAALSLKVVIDPALTETALEADFVLPCPTGYEKWEICGFPNGYPEIKTQLRPPVVPCPEGALPEPEIYARLAEAMGLFGPAPGVLRGLAKSSRPLFFVAAAALAKAASVRARNGLQSRLLFWAYRTLGPELESPSLAAIWLLCHANAMSRREAVLRALGEEHRRKTPFALAAELYARVLAHPEGVVVAELDPRTHLDDNIGHADRKIHLSPASMMAEIARALAAPASAAASAAASPGASPGKHAGDGADTFPMVLAAGLRTHWTANTIQRDPAWRKGKGPHCALSISPEDAGRLGISAGNRVRLVTRGGAAEIEAQVDARLPAGFVSIPNGFGLRYGKAGGELGPLDGLNANELTSADDRDPFTGCPHHKHVACRIEALGAGAR
jgi:anaerobic selenocysteine-containing dehydrogenase